jgi:hypothetical protein
MVSERPEDALMRSVREFRETLESLTWQGASQIAERSQLVVLARKYPELASEVVGQLNAEATTNTPPGRRG